MEALKGGQGKSALLDRSEERVRLLKAGFSGKEIEALYLVLNSIEIMDVNWRPAA